MAGCFFTVFGLLLVPLLRLGARTVEQRYGKHLHAWAERKGAISQQMEEGVGQNPKDEKESL
jgi:hypothetical protein